MDKIMDLMNENKNVNMFIKDFILHFRFPEFALHTKDADKSGYMITYTSVSKMAEKYEKDSSVILREYEKNIKRVCDSNNVKSKCERDDILGLKKEIDNEKKKSINKIIKQFRNTAKYGFSSGKIEDYMLYEHYANYLLSDDFYYDKDNPYVVELFKLLNDFMRMRSRIELNCQSIDGMVTKFNKDCGSVVARFWGNRKKDYYTYLKDLFRYDFYTNVDDDLIEAKINDDNRVTLYEKVLNFLKDICHYVPPTSPDEKYKELSFEEMSNANSPKKIAIDNKYSKIEKNNESLLKSLKKIALDFVKLRKIEVNHGDYKYFSKYISKSDLTQVFTAKEELAKYKIDIKNYSSTTTNSRMLKYKNALKKYLGALQSITQDESNQLNDLCERAINWYLNKSESVENGEALQEFIEPSWSSPTKVFKDDEGHDFYYVQIPKTQETPKKTIDSSGNITYEGDPYVYTEDSLKTKFGVNEYGYWLKYCTMATIVNCMMPMYWGTGLILPSGPLSLPIIFIPIVVISGRVTIVIGLGLCGICPLPMILFVNMSDVPAFPIPIINMAIDMLRQLAGKLVGLSAEPIKGMIKGMIKGYDEAINSINNEIDQIDTDILNLRSGVDSDLETLRNMKKRLKKQSNSKRKGAGD